MAASTSPLVISLGKKKGKDIRRLERGGGRLMAEVEAAMASAGGERVVVVVRKKERRPKRRPVLPALVALRLLAARRRRPRVLVGPRRGLRRVAAGMIRRALLRRLTGR